MDATVVANGVQPRTHHADALAESKILKYKRSLWNTGVLFQALFIDLWLSRWRDVLPDCTLSCKPISHLLPAAGVEDCDSIFESFSCLVTKSFLYDWGKHLL